MISVFILCYW